MILAKSLALWHTGLIYGAEAHLVANLTLNGRYHLVVFGEPFSALSGRASCLLTVFCLVTSS